MVRKVNGLFAFETDGFVVGTAADGLRSTDLEPGIRRDMAAGVDFEFIPTRQELEKFNGFVIRFHPGQMMVKAGGGVQYKLRGRPAITRAGQYFITSETLGLTGHFQL